MTGFAIAARAEQARFDLNNGHVVFQPVPVVLTEEETEVPKATVKSEVAVAAIAEAAEVSRTTAIEFFQTPAELGERFRIPRPTLRIQGQDGLVQLQLFDDPEVLEYPWGLSPFDATPTADDLAAMGDDRLIGGLWANLSEERCRFVMVKDKRWDGIEPLLQ